MVLCLSISGFCSGTDAFKVKGLLGISLAGTKVTDNWTGGETDSMGWSANLETNIEKTWVSVLFLTKLKLDYGLTVTGSNNISESADRIYADLSLSHNMVGRMDVYGGLIVETQFSLFADPLTLIERTGVGFYFLKDEVQKLQAQIGAGLRELFATVKDGVSITDDPITAQIENVKIEGGLDFCINYELSISETTLFSSQFKSFSPLVDFSSTYFNWDSGLYVKLSEYLTLKLSHLAFYNKDSVPGYQSKFSTLLGVSYSIF